MGCLGSKLSSSKTQSSSKMGVDRVRSVQIEQNNKFSSEKSAAPRYIQQELKEMQSNPSNEFMRLPLPKLDCKKEEEWRALTPKAPLIFLTPVHPKFSNQIRKDLPSKGTLVASNSGGHNQKLDCKKEEERRALTPKAPPIFLTPVHPKFSNQIRKDLPIKGTLPKNSGGPIQVIFQNDLDPKKLAVNIIAHNNIFAKDAKNVGFSRIANMR